MSLAPLTENQLAPGRPGPCRFCGTEMPWNAEHGYWLCPVCRAAQFPPEPPEPPAERGFRTIEDLWADEQRHKRSVSKRGGGGERAGRKRRKPTRRWHLRLIAELSDDSRK